MDAIAIPKGFKVTPEQFEQLAYAEQLARMELSKDRELIIMSPTGGEAGRKNFNLYIDLGIWNRQRQLGQAFDSSTVFILPNGARRSPDVSWIKLDRWNQLNQAQQDGFPSLAPVNLLNCEKCLFKKKPSKIITLSIVLLYQKIELY